MREPDTFEILHDEAEAIGRALVRPGVSPEEAETVEAITRSVARWAESALDAAAIEAAHTIPAPVRRQAAELGLYGLTVPEAHGGAGLSLTGAGHVVETLARHDRSVAVSIGLHNGLGLRGLIAYGRPELQAELLPALAAGERIAAFAATEPGAGSHIAGVRSVARPDEDDEDTLRLDGEKVFVTNGGFADLYTVLARTPGLGGARRGYSLLLVDRSSEGLEVGREEDKLGIRASSTTPLSFEGVRVPRARVLGEPGKGLDLMNAILAWGRTLMSAGALGGAREACARAMTHALTRKQFGKPLAAFGLVREKLARMHARLYAMESLFRLTGLMQASYGSDIVWISTATKVFCSDGACEVADEAIQVHGGLGFIEEIGVARILRDCRITRIFEGANEVLRFHLAAGALPFAGETPRALSERLPGPLEAHARRFDALHRRTRDVLTGLAETFGPRVMEHQLRLAGCADAFIGLLALEASLLRGGAELGDLSGEAATAHLDRLAFLAELLGREIEDGLRQAEDERFETTATRLAGHEVAAARARL